MEWTVSEADRGSNVPVELGCPSQPLSFCDPKTSETKTDFLVAKVNTTRRCSQVIAEQFSNFQLPQMERAQTAAETREKLVLEPL